MVGEGNIWCIKDTPYKSIKSTLLMSSNSPYTLIDPHSCYKVSSLGKPMHPVTHNLMNKIVRNLCADTTK